jgi:replicative DNA helicase
MPHENISTEEFELIEIFSEMDLEEYLKSFPEGVSISQKEIEVFEARRNLLLEKGRNQELYGKLKESKKLVGDLKKFKTISKRNEKEKNRIRGPLEFGKIPPQNVALEEIVLGSYIKFPNLMKESEFSQPYLNLMWYKENHLKIHSTLMNTSKKITSQVLISELRRMSELDVIGGPRMIEKLTSNKEITDNISTIDMYIEELEYHFGKRNLIGFANDLAKIAYDDSQIESLPEFIREQSSKLLELLPFRYRKAYDKKSAIVQVKEDLKQLKERKGKPKISTGFEQFDRITHGILPGKLIITGARGKMGKTAFTTAIAENVVSQGYDAAYFSHEVPLNEMVNRLVSRKTGISLSRFEYNPQGFSEKEDEKIAQAFIDIEKSSLHLEAGRVPNLEYIVNRSKQLKMAHPDLAMIVFDGIQAYGHLVPERGNKSDFFTNVMKTMKEEIAEELRVSVFLNAQLKTTVDEGYKGPGKKYNKSFMPSSAGDFSDCKGIKDLCDGAFGLWRGEYYFPEEEKYKGKLKIIPLDLRSEDRHIKPIDVGCDMSNMNIYDLEK